ncbi:GntR family transcriptional regulator [Nitratireductor sp.]|uniref:GntR family transcriptional regulator n=1 Tax=Nitratireductor sp. TaxID=1872084 RepID=UPI0025CF1B46|nr:GntR family transcriptional regulator [Nitratireductor sp.]
MDSLVASGTGTVRLPNVLGLELAQIIERLIIRLEFEPGQHLTEQQICERFDVSRSPVREAFRQLEAIGLVVRHTRKGIRVTDMTPEHVDEIYFVRTPLESIAASCAARNASKADIEYLERAVDALDKSLAQDDAEAFFDANMAYFDRVHAITGNRTLENILRTIEKQAMRYRYFAHTHSREMQEHSAGDLRKVLLSIRDRNEQDAHDRTLVMMRNAQARIVGIVQQYCERQKDIR